MTTDYYNYQDIYDTSQNCETWNSDFWKKHSPDNYNNCIREQNRHKQMLSQGKCEKIIKKSYSYGGQNCVFNIINSRKMIAGTACDSYGQATATLKDVEKMFKQQYGYK